MNLYFGNFVTTVSTIIVCMVWTFIIYSAIHHKKIKNWGRMTAILALSGLVLCCFVATRDGYDKSVQASTDSSIQAGIFTVTSIQSLLACIGGCVIAFSAISSIFVKNQKYRKIMFFCLSLAIIFKTILIEVSRICFL